MAIIDQQQQQPAPKQQAPGQNMSPEKIEQAQKVFQIGDNIMWNKQTFDAIMQEVQKDPTEGLSDAIVMILSKSKELVGGLDKEAAMVAGLQLMMNLVEAINETGRVQIDGNTVTEAVQLAVQKYLMVAQADGDDMSDLENLIGSFSGGA